mmetsp:Transcript_24389/g.51896  ORF Transcript_24389/g.51896 Transcript_24389/m.51896 type:complete len:224 (+) Transcript_24389:800-1471(+)
MVDRPFREVKAVRTERKGPWRGTDGVEAELKVTVLDGTLAARPLLDLTTHRQRVHGFGKLVVQPGRRTGNKRQVPPGFPASRKRFADVLEFRETGTEQNVHAAYVVDKIVELLLENLDGMADDNVFLQVTRGDLVALPLDVGSDPRKDQSAVDLVVALAQHETQLVGDEAPARFEPNIIPLLDVFDVGGDAGIGSDPVFFHHSDELRLRKETRGGGHFFLDVE